MSSHSPDDARLPAVTPGPGGRLSEPVVDGATGIGG